MSQPRRDTQAVGVDAGSAKEADDSSERGDCQRHTQEHAVQVVARLRETDSCPCEQIAGNTTLVSFGDFSLGSPEGLTFVTAYGSSNGWCTKSFGSTSGTVRVNCYDGAGRLQPAGTERFTISSIPDALLAGRAPVNAPASVVPTHGGGVAVDPFLPDACPADPPRGIVRTQFNSTGGTNTACFDAKNNKWIVEFEGLKVGKSATTLVSATHDPTDSGSSRYCNVVRTPAGATGPQVHVRCFNGDGTPNNLTGFTLLYLTDDVI